MFIYFIFPLNHLNFLPTNLHRKITGKLQNYNSKFNSITVKTHRPRPSTEFYTNLERCELHSFYFLFWQHFLNKKTHKRMKGKNVAVMDQRSVDRQNSMTTLRSSPPVIDFIKKLPDHWDRDSHKETRDWMRIDRGSDCREIAIPTSWQGVQY